MFAGWQIAKHDVVVLRGRVGELEPFSFPQSRKAAQSPIISLVGKILAAKREDPEADTTRWEDEIHRIVFGLYGLSQDEIALVEASRGSGSSATV